MSVKRLIYRLVILIKTLSMKNEFFLSFWYSWSHEYPEEFMTTRMFWGIHAVMNIPRNSWGCGWLTEACLCYVQCRHFCCGLFSYEGIFIFLYLYRIVLYRITFICLPLLLPYYLYLYCISICWWSLRIIN